MSSLAGWRSLYVGIGRVLCQVDEFSNIYNVMVILVYVYGILGLPFKSL